MACNRCYDCLSLEAVVVIDARPDALETSLLVDHFPQKFYAAGSFLMSIRDPEPCFISTVIEKSQGVEV